MGYKGQTLSKAIEERLDQLGMSRRELARRSGLSRQTIHNVEHGGNTNLKATTFIALDKALRWKSGQAKALATGQTLIRGMDHREVLLVQIKYRLAMMTVEEIELTLFMLDEHELGNDQTKGAIA